MRNKIWKKVAVSSRQSEAKTHSGKHEKLVIQKMLIKKKLIKQRENKRQEDNRTRRMGRKKIVYPSNKINKNHTNRKKDKAVGKQDNSRNG